VASRPRRLEHREALERVRELEERLPVGGRQRQDLGQAIRDPGRVVAPLDVAVGVARLGQHLVHDLGEPGLVRRHGHERVRGDVEHAAPVQPVRLAPGLHHAHAFAAYTTDAEQPALEAVEIHDPRLRAGRGE
jgi:hypothetical protein